MEVSYSYMPERNTPRTTKVLTLGVNPAADWRPEGDRMFTTLPTVTPVRSASSLPRMMPGNCPGASRSASSPATMSRGRLRTSPAVAGSMPRRITPLTPPELLSITSV